MEEMNTEFQRQDDDQEIQQQNVDQQDETPNEKRGRETSVTFRLLFTTVDLRQPLFVACMLQVMQQFSGINAVSMCVYVCVCVSECVCECVCVSVCVCVAEH